MKCKCWYSYAEDDTVILVYPKAVLYTTTEPQFLLKILQHAKHMKLPYAFDKEKAVFKRISDKKVT